MMVINTPNLDAEMEPEELNEFAWNLQKLAHYATCKASAIVARRAGLTLAALGHEKMCDQTYNQLPLKWRW